MLFKQHVLDSYLSKYILEINYIKDFHPGHTKEKYLPDGTINLVFELAGKPKYIYRNGFNEKVQECRDVWFSGVQRDYITISAEAEEMMVLVFKPGAGFPLIGETVSKYSNKVVPAQQIFGSVILDLHGQIQKDASPESKFLSVEHWLKEQLNEDDFYRDIIQYALNAIEESPNQIVLGTLVEKSGYSQKQFIQLFKKYVGITPKRFHRIVRFNKILSAVENKEQISWTAIAADCGYFDQSHFIKDFQSFSGINPKKYLKDIEDYPNFLPVK